MRTDKLTTLAQEAIQNAQESVKNTDVVMDFSSDDGARRAVEIATQCNAALLVGTTGLSEKTVLAIQNASQKISTIKISNSSFGIVILTRLASLATTILGSQASITIQETHHTGKKDSPSGTAIALAEAVRASGADITNTGGVCYAKHAKLGGGDIRGVQFAGGCKPPAS